MHSRPSLLVVALGSAAVVWLLLLRRSRQPLVDDEARPTDKTTYELLIGNTPMVELRRASALLGCRILVKMESLNPGGTGKDRASMYMLREGEASGQLKRGDCVVEGTSGR